MWLEKAKKKGCKQFTKMQLLWIFPNNKITNKVIVIGPEQMITSLQ